jgi:hypothetical protein
MNNKITFYSGKRSGKDNTLVSGSFAKLHKGNQHQKFRLSFIQMGVMLTTLSKFHERKIRPKEERYIRT